MKKLAIITLAVFGGMGVAYAAGDAEAGKAKAAACAACHGADGNSMVPMFPRLAGQHAAYLEKQLQDFKSGDRKDPTMSGMATPLSNEDIADLAAYFASQTVAGGSGGGDAEKVAAGEKLYRGGNKETNTPACAACHGPTGTGQGGVAKIAALRGQHAAYIAKAVKDFRSGDRANDRSAMMRQATANLTDSEIEAVAEYIASLQ